jgi:WD40 repeat protein
VRTPATRSEFKVIRTSGARPAPGAAPVATTAVACASTKSFFAGHADGVVRAFGLVSGAVERTFRPPATYTPNAAVPNGAAVTAIALYGSLGGTADQQVLAVGHADGTIHNYSAASGAFLMEFSSRPGLTQLLSLRRFSSLAAVHAGDNSLTLWDLASLRPLVLDFSAELTSINRRSSIMTCCRYDDARGVILCGTDDGSVFVRAVTRIEGTGDLSVRLSRFCAPSAGAQAPSRVSGRRLQTEG